MFVGHPTMSSRMALALSADLSGDSQHALPPLGKLSADPAETFPQTLASDGAGAVTMGPASTAAGPWGELRASHTREPHQAPCTASG